MIRLCENYKSDIYDMICDVCNKKEAVKIDKVINLLYKYVQYISANCSLPESFDDVLKINKTDKVIDNRWHIDMRRRKLEYLFDLWTLPLNIDFNYEDICDNYKKFILFLSQECGLEYDVYNNNISTNHVTINTEIDFEKNSNHISIYSTNIVKVVNYNVNDVNIVFKGIQVLGSEKRSGVSFKVGLYECFDDFMKEYERVCDALKKAKYDLFICIGVKFIFEDNKGKKYYFGDDIDVSNSSYSQYIDGSYPYSFDVNSIFNHLSSSYLNYNFNLVDKF